MKLTRRRCVMSALALGALASTTLLGVAPAAAADDPAINKLTPTVSAGTLSRLVPYGSALTITATLKAAHFPLAQQSVQTCTAPVNGDFTCKSTTTSAAGTVAVAMGAITAPVRMKVIVAEGVMNYAGTSDTYTVTPQVGVRVARKGTAMTVTLTGADNQYLVLKRIDGSKSVFVSFQQSSDGTSTFNGLLSTRRYQVVVGDTATIRGNTSAAA